MTIHDSSFTSHDPQLISQTSPLTSDDISISVHNLSKQYRLFNSPEERLKEALHPFKKKYHREFWALKDVSFDVPKGATVGIIGRNGSGKSTLLQLICGVLNPTTGSVSVKGRISALLELGAGFNPDMTGSQNVILNGIVQGFSKEEMNSKLPKIREFADIGEFFDQPVKIYSSGMFVRLAFAAAINVAPEILIVDEALAVGDAKFQNKCYNKFLEFQKAGKTILFVTHDINAIAKHCDHAILLENGSILESGKPNDVVNRYFKVILTGDLSDEVEMVSDKPAFIDSASSPAESHHKSELDRFLEEIPTTDKCIHRNSYNKNEYRFGDRRAEFVDYLVVCGGVNNPAAINSGDMIEVYLKAKSYGDIESPLIGYEIKTADGVYIYCTNTNLMEIEFSPIKQFDVLNFKFSLGLLNLKPGDYFISFGIAEKQSGINGFECKMIDSRNDIIHLSILGRNNFNGLLGLNTSCAEISRMRAT